MVPMKTIGLVLFTLLGLAFPALAVEYQGKIIDGQKFTGTVYSYQTGGLYEAQIEFDGGQAWIYFAGGEKVRVTLHQRVLTDLAGIEAYGRPGYLALGRSFSVGLGSDSGDNWGTPATRALAGYWRINLDAKEINRP